MIVLDISNPKNTQLIAADGTETGLSVQDLMNALCNVLDGIPAHELVDRAMAEDADHATHIDNVRNIARQFWTYTDGRKVLG